MLKEQKAFVPESEQVIELLFKHAPNVISAEIIGSYLDTSKEGVEAAVARAKKVLKQNEHPLCGKAEIKAMRRVGYRLAVKEEI